MASLEEILGPDEIEDLLSTKFESSGSTPPKRDKYKPYKEILETNRGLKEKIERMFERSQMVPAIHITSRAIKTESGEVSSGFVENIKENSFRIKDTNVGVLMQRQGTRQPATPRDFVEKPEKFLRELETLIRHYYHHGVRTNKALLGDSRDVGMGLPVMLLVDVTDSSLEEGSDYEDHYRIGKSIPSSRIIGEVELDGIGSEIRNKLPEIADKFLELTEEYINTNSQN